MKKKTYHIIEFVSVLIGPAFCFLPLYFVAAHFASLKNTDYGYLLLSPVDPMIPYVTILTPFYTSLFEVLPLVFIITSISVAFNERFIRQSYISTLLGIIILLSFFYFIPTSASALVEHSTAPSSGYFYKFFMEICSDMPLFNSFPSGHIFLSWLTIRLCGTYIALGRIKYLYIAILYAWFTLMALSTMTLKFHYFYDVIAGIFIAELLIYIIVKKNIFQVELWTDYLPLRYIVIIETLVSVSLCILVYISYPNYMQFTGHRSHIKATVSTKQQDLTSIDFKLYSQVLN